MGEGESLMIEMPFQSMNAVERTRAKFRTCAANCRGWRLESAEIIVFLAVYRCMCFKMSGMVMGERNNAE